MLNIKQTDVPKGATHISQHGSFIKDLGEFFPYNPNRPELGNEATEIYYEWSRTLKEWVVKFGRHLSKVEVV